LSLLMCAGGAFLQSEKFCAITNGVTSHSVRCDNRRAVACQGASNQHRDYIKETGENYVTIKCSIQ
jgi:hypothetical protein